MKRLFRGEAYRLTGYGIQERVDKKRHPNFVPIVSSVLFVPLVLFPQTPSSLSIKNKTATIEEMVFVFWVLGAKKYTVAGRAIGFAPEQPLHAVAIACSAFGILK
ncbi:MAG: hypothetical protein LBJ00_12495 [Planctomycetaceae bacterium]|nr:hypothetical protein [Planctomycetaceae bacterium]